MFHLHDCNYILADPSSNGAPPVLENAESAPVDVDMVNSCNSYHCIVLINLSSLALALALFVSGG